MTSASPKTLATSLFARAFASQPSVLASAPGRVNLIGEHTDYNQGPVLPFAVERRTVVAAGSSSGWQAVSAIDGTPHLVDPDAPPTGAWTDYVRGVIRVLRRNGLAPVGARIAVASALSLGAGLASSAALTVSLAKALAMLAGRRVQSRVLADLAYEAEHDEVGVRCGRMDPVVAALASPGMALFLETRTGEISELSLPGHVTVLETGVTHRLAQGELNQRRKQCEEALAMLVEHGLQATSLAEIPPAELPRLERVLPRPWFQRARHVITETARTRAAARALAMRDVVTLGGLLYQGHASLRDDYQSTCPEADLIVDAARRSGALGARLTGAGWGGAVVLLAPTVHEARIVAEVGDRFHREFGRFPDLWTSKAAGGVRSDK